MLILSTVIFYCGNANSEVITIRPKNTFKYRHDNKAEILFDIKCNEPIKSKLIALTFDDGPHKKRTQIILDILKKYEVKATFFVIGKRVLTNKNVLTNVFNEGHEIGNHSMSHPTVQTLNYESLKNEFNLTNELIKKTTIADVKYIRPPYGTLNNTVRKISKQLQNKIVLWSWDQDTKDWKEKNINKIAKKVLDNAYCGDIVLFHDNISTTPKVLEIIIPSLIEMGFNFVTISELIASVHNSENYDCYCYDE